MDRPSGLMSILVLDSHDSKLAILSFPVPNFTVSSILCSLNDHIYFHFHQFLWKLSPIFRSCTYWVMLILRFGLHSSSRNLKKLPEHWLLWCSSATVACSHHSTSLILENSDEFRNEYSPQVSGAQLNSECLYFPGQFSHVSTPPQTWPHFQAQYVQSRHHITQ